MSGLELVFLAKGAHLILKMNLWADIGLLDHSFPWGVVLTLANFSLAVRASYILPILKHSLGENLEKHEEVLFLPLDITKTQKPVCHFEFWGGPLKLAKSH